MKLRQYKNDITVSFFLFLAVYTAFFMGCNSLLNSGFYNQMNIAFDFDQNWFFDFVGRPHESWLYRGASSKVVLLFKHPFMYFYYDLAYCLQALGVSVEHSVIAVSLLFHSLSAVILFVIFRLNKFSTVKALFFTLAYTFSATFLVNGLVLDTYSLVSFWIAVIFLVLTLKATQNIEVNEWCRAAIAAFAVGTTLYLLLLVVMLELYLAYKREGNVSRVLVSKSLYFQALRAAVLLAAGMVIIYHEILVEVISDPIGYFKSVYWLVQRPGEKAGLIQVIKVFTTFSLVAPGITTITLADGVQMGDFRELSFSPFGWIGFLLVGVIVFAQLNRNSDIKIFSLIWLLICVAFHLVYQDRGSLFLYTGHFVLAVWLLYFLQKPASTYLQAATYLAVTSIAINNSLFLVTFFGLYARV